MSRPCYDENETMKAFRFIAPTHGIPVDQKYARKLQKEIKGKKSRMYQKRRMSRTHQACRPVCGQSVTKLGADGSLQYKTIAALVETQKNECTMQCDGRPW